MRLLSALIVPQLVSLTANGFAPGPGVGCGIAHRHRQALCGGPWLNSHAKRQVTSEGMSSVSAPSSLDETALIKTSLLQVAAITERGQLATKAQREYMQQLVERFEELKVEEQPYKDENMALLGREDMVERIFSFTDAIPNAKIGQARQIVNEDCTELLSRVDMSIWPHRLISGVVETRSRIVNDDVGDRLEVIVDDTKVVESLLGKISPQLEAWRVPVDQLSERIFDRIPRITLDTVFLDEDLRVSRLPDRNFLVYVKDIEEGRVRS